MPDAKQKRIPAVPLPANSFDLGELDKAIAGAVRGKEEERAGKVVEAVRSTANLAEVLKGQEGTPAPEGTEFKGIESQTGQKVTAPVAIAADARSGQEAASQELEGTAEVQGAAETGGGTK